MQTYKDVRKFATKFEITTYFDYKELGHVN